MIRREAMTLIRHPSAYLAVLVVAVVVVFSLLSPQFGTVENYVTLASGSVSLGILALGVTIALAAGAADFSIAGNAALAGVIAGLVGESLGPELGFLVAIACGISIGAAIGLVISRYNLNTFLVTLAMAGSLRGMAFVLSGSSSGFFIDSGPSLSLGQGSTLGIPNAILVLFVAILASVLLLEHTSTGRTFLATGGNPEAARLVGIRTKSTVTLAYAVSGGAAALAGLLLAGRAGVAIPQAANGSELLVFTAVLLGGNRLSGGRSSISGSILAVLLVNALYTGFVLLKMSPYLQTIMQGALLILAVLVLRLQSDIHASLRMTRQSANPPPPEKAA